MNKKAKYTVNGGLVGGIGMAVWNIWKQLNCDTEKQFDWRGLFISFLKGVAIGAAGGFTIGAICDYRNSKEIPIDTDARLLSLISSVRLSPKDENYLAVLAKSTWLINVLQAEFGTKLKHKPYRFGSTEKQTALSEDFDIDICLSFTPAAFSSTQEMYYTVLDFLTSLKGTANICNIRSQRKSIGVFFYVNGKEQKIDVLPQKITKARGNNTSGYLYVNKNGLFEEPSRTKTDIKLLNDIKLSETQKKILVALKMWKRETGLSISSHLLQYLIIDAYKSNVRKIPRHFTEKVILVFTHIMDNIESLQLRSIENTNNVLTNMLPEEKSRIRDACRKILNNYAYQPNAIVHFFQ